MEEDLSLWYDNSGISWKYMGQKLQRVIYGIEYASIQGKYIYVETYKDNGICCFYISFNNKKVICYDDKKQLISIDNKPAISFEQKPYGVDISNDACICVLLNDHEMRLYNENGDYIRSIASPSGYSYFRFFSVGDDISVVCQGNTGNEDGYGRNDWKFKYKDRSWVKEGEAY